MNWASVKDWFLRFVRKKGADIAIAVVSVVLGCLLSGWIAWQQAMKIIDVQRGESLVAQASPSPSAFLVRNPGVQQQRVLFATLQPNLAQPFVAKGPAVRFDSDVLIQFTEGDYDHSRGMYQRAVGNIVVNPGEQMLFRAQVEDLKHIPPNIIAGTLVLYYGDPAHPQQVAFQPTWIERAMHAPILPPSEDLSP